MSLVERGVFEARKIHFNTGLNIKRKIGYGCIIVLNYLDAKLTILGFKLGVGTEINFWITELHYINDYFVMGWKLLIAFLIVFWLYRMDKNHSSKEYLLFSIALLLPLIGVLSWVSIWGGLL